MNKSKTKYSQLAYNSIKSYLKKGNTKELDFAAVPDEMQRQAACFVSLHNADGSLRGCMGTIEPMKDNLYEEIIRNSISVATRDFRFNILKLKELDKIEISVYVLSEAIKIESIDELDPQKYGVIVSDGRHQKGVLLPGIETIDTVEQQLNIARKKAGLDFMPFEKLEFFKFETEIYY